jgi:hypothetical protein
MRLVMPGADTTASGRGARPSNLPKTCMPLEVWLHAPRFGKQPSAPLLSRRSHLSKPKTALRNCRSSSCARSAAVNRTRSPLALRGLFGGAAAGVVAAAGASAWPLLTPGEPCILPMPYLMGADGHGDKPWSWGQRMAMGCHGPHCPTCARCLRPACYGDAKVPDSRCIYTWY